MRKLAQKLWQLSPAERRALAIAATTILGIRAQLATRSYQAVLRSIEAKPGPSGSPSSQDAVDRIAWAVSAVGRRLPGSNCLDQALAGHALLRQAGHTPDLKIGVQNESEFKAHAWLELGGQILIGASDEPFAELTKRD